MTGAGVLFRFLSFPGCARSPSELWSVCAWLPRPLFPCFSRSSTALWSACVWCRFPGFARSSAVWIAVTGVFIYSSHFLDMPGRPLWSARAGPLLHFLSFLALPGRPLSYGVLARGLPPFIPFPGSSRSSTALWSAGDWCRCCFHLGSSLFPGSARSPSELWSVCAWLPRPLFPGFSRSSTALWSACDWCRFPGFARSSAVWIAATGVFIYSSHFLDMPGRPLWSARAGPLLHFLSFPGLARSPTELWSACAGPPALHSISWPC